MMRKALVDKRLQIGFLAFAAAVLIPTLLGLPAASGQSTSQGDAGLPAGPAFVQDQSQPKVPLTQKPENVPAITLTKTVGTNPATCATAHSITLPPWGGQVTYCFTATNSGGVVLARHSLIDDQLGVLLLDFPYDLEPYTSYAVTHTATIVAPTTNTATWAAIGAGQTVWASDSATVRLEGAPPAPLDCNGPPVGFDQGIPSDWSVRNNAPGNPVGFTHLQGCGESGNYATGSGGAACASSALQGGGSGRYDTELRTPPLDLTGAVSATLAFEANYQDMDDGDSLTVDASDDNGVTWTTLLRWDTSHGAFRSLPGEPGAVDLSAYAGRANVRVRWRYADSLGPAGSPDWYAQVDDVGLTCQLPSVALTKTVGTDLSLCATTGTVTLPPAGGEVVYCYTAENTGDVSLSLHDLDDSALGAVLSGFSYELLPDASVAVTRSAFITATTVNTATWLAHYVSGATISASDSATVTLEPPAPAIVLTKTVGLDPAVCAATNTLAVLSSAEVVYCYEVHNTGNIAFDFHDLYDDALGSLLFHWPTALAPGATLAITHSVSITATTTNEGTWTAFSANGLWAIDDDTAVVLVTSNDPNIVVDPTRVEAIQAPDQVTTRTLTIANTGLSQLEWTVEESLTPGCECPFDVSWLAVIPISGTTSSATSDAVQVIVDSTGLPFSQYYESALCIRSNDPDPGPGNETGFVIVPASLITAVPDAVTASELSAASATPAPLRWLILIAVPAAGILALAAGWLVRQRRRSTWRQP
jgi:hypothetical protein